ncbi:MAG: hypothetical protein ABJQ34_19100 [Paracoccaceae bacterium]
MSYPIFALWAHPRSMSTALERLMRNRPDCHVFHEPFLGKYYNQIGKDVPGVEMAAFDVNYAEVRDRIVSQGEISPVFVKDMSYHVLPEFFDDTAFCDRLNHVFLIRDPRKSIPSVHKQDEGLTLNEVGYEAQWKQYQFIANRSPENELVVEAEDIGRDTETMMQRIWVFCGFDNCPKALNWEGKPFPKELRIVQDWHENLKNSAGIYRDERDPNAVFSAAVGAAPKLGAVLEHHKPFFEKLRSNECAA